MLTSNFTNKNPELQQRGTLETALRWLDRGVSVVPAQPRSKQVLLHWRVYDHHPPTIDQVKSWFENGVMNLALVCGSGGLVVLDFDQADRFTLWAAEAGVLSNTYTEITGRGVHLFYEVEGESITPRLPSCVGVDLLGLGHLVIAAPSIHPSGFIYRSARSGVPILKVSYEQLTTSLLSKELLGKELLADTAGQLVAPLLNLIPRGWDRDLVSKIKAKISLLEKARDLTNLKASGGDGRWWYGRCPFHEDSQPSFWLDAVRGVWGCYSPGCPGHRGGDVINLYALSHGIGVGQAIRELAGSL